MSGTRAKRIAWAAAALLGLAVSSVGGADDDSATARGPLVIGHRGGGSGYLPDHTLEAYALGIELGADYVELDLVATKDGHLIVRHEPNLLDTTNVGTLPQFASRKRTVEIDGAPVTGFFASDFTLAELKQLRAVQPLAERGRAFDGKFEVPTLEESILLVKRKSAEKGRRIGVYVETKHPTYHQSIGLPLEDRLLEALRRAGWDRRGAPVFIQSFETASLRHLRTRTDLPLIQLMDADDLTPDGAVALNRPYDKPRLGRVRSLGLVQRPAQPGRLGRGAHLRRWDWTLEAVRPQLEVHRGRGRRLCRRQRRRQGRRSRPGSAATH